MNDGPAPAPTILVVGDVMTDIIVRPHGPLVPGSDRTADIALHPGGSGANQAVWLAAHGARVRFCARVGAGDAAPMAAQFARAGVEARLSADPDCGSGVLVTLLSENGERSFLTDRGANGRLCAADLTDDLLDDAGLLLVSGYSLFAPGPRAAVLGLFERARARAIPIAVDAASSGFLETVGPAAFLDWVSGAGILFANADEAQVLTGKPDHKACLAELAPRFAMVALKRGALGALLAVDGSVVAEAAAPNVPVLDTTGAGDAFAAAFLVAWTGGRSLPECLQGAVEAGAHAVQQVGGRPIVPAGREHFGNT